MSFEIEAVEARLERPKIESHDATIKDVTMINTKYGQRLQVEFELKEGVSVIGRFPLKATLNNITAKLLFNALHDRRTANSDELIGKRVTIMLAGYEFDEISDMDVTDFI